MEPLTFHGITLQATNVLHSADAKRLQPMSYATMRQLVELRRALWQTDSEEDRPAQGETPG